jgi:hypothetical protein
MTFCYDRLMVFMEVFGIVCLCAYIEITLSFLFLKEGVRNLNSVPLPISSRIVAGPVSDFPMRAGNARHFSSVTWKNLLDRRRRIKSKPLIFLYILMYRSSELT